MATSQRKLATARSRLDTVEGSLLGLFGFETAMVAAIVTAALVRLCAP